MREQIRKERNRPMNRTWISIGVLLMTVTFVNGCLSVKEGILSTTVGEEQYFALLIADQVIGYNTYKVVETKTFNDREVAVVDAHTILKMQAPSGEEVTSDYATTTYYYDDFTPARYVLALSSGNQEHTIEVDFPGIDLPEGTYITDGNVFNHYVFLFRTLPLNRGQNIKVPLLMPQLSKDTPLQVSLSVKDELESVESDGTTHAALLVEARTEKLPFMQFWITEEGRLVKLAVPSQQFSMVAADAGVIARVKGIGRKMLMEKILAQKFAPSNVQFSFMTNVRFMKAEVDVTVLGETVDESSLNTARQAFKGTVTDNVVKGVFETRVSEYRGAGYSLPMAFDSSFESYLQAEPKIESDDPLIVAHAREITQNSDNAWQVVRNIADWVYKNIRYEITGAGAKQALTDGKGDCGPHALLAVALARAIGIPSRVVGGFASDGGRFGQHYWVENYMGSDGWIPSDPTVGEYGWIDATHIRLFSSQNAGIDVFTGIHVVEFVDRGRDTVTLGQKKLALSVGETWRYTFRLQGVEFASNEYEATSREEKDGLIFYNLRSKLQMDLSKIGASGNVSLDATLTVNDKAQPYIYSVTADVDSQKQTVEAKLKENTMHTVVVVGDKTHEKQIDLEPDTVLLANNMIGWFDLMYRTLPLETGASYNVNTYFPGNFLKLTITINVRAEMTTIEVGGKTYDVFVCDVPLLKEVDYVSEEGALVKIEVPAQKVEIERTTDGSM